MTPADRSALEAYVAVLRGGGIVACPTETFYGLLADAWSASAVGAIIALKRRGPDPIALLAPDLATALALADALPPDARALAERHWPGPLTLVVRTRAALPAGIVREGTVGVRVPGPSPALDLTRAFGGLLTATSCNVSGQPAARTDAEARGYFPDGLAAVVAGTAPGQAPSTIIDATEPGLRVLRAGAITLA
jgi:L-threonylcarbamoyladenylate synthase